MKKICNKILRILPDQWFIQLKYFYHFHRFANLKNPKTFNEKLQWLKLHDRNPLYTTLVDKYAVKKWVADRIGEQYIIPTLGVWDKAEDIDFDKLPNQFVLKCTHDSHSIVICRDKTKLNKQETIQKLSKCLKSNGYWYGREWPYKNVLPRVIAEKYMVDEKTNDLPDYKFLCFNGKAHYVEIHRGRFTSAYSQTFYDMNGQVQPFNNKGYQIMNKTSLPKEALLHLQPLVNKLATGLPQARIDFYYINHHPYFGEITFFDGSGYVPFTPTLWDKKLGDLIKLPMRK